MADGGLSFTLVAMKLIMIGTGPFAVPTLTGLYQTHHDVAALVTSPVRARSAKQVVPVSPLRDLAHEHGMLAFRRSLFVVAPIRKGEQFTSENVRSIRPANGLHTRHFDEIIGKTAACDIEAGTPLNWTLVSAGAATRGR